MEPIGAITVSPLSGLSNMVAVRLDGNLPSPCYSDPSVQQPVVSGNRISISLDSVLTFAPCAAILVPFSKTVVVGPLVPGAYTVSSILFENGNFVGQLTPAGFSVPIIADVPATSLVTLAVISAGLVLLRYRLVRAG